MRPTIKSDEDLVKINELIGDCLEKAKPVTGIPEVEAGARMITPVFMQIYGEDWGFDFTVEYVMPTAPKDESQGYTMDDFTRRDRVGVARILEEAKEGRPKKFRGELMRLADFYTEYQTDTVNQIRIDRVMERMEAMIRPTDMFMHKINELWVNRVPGVSPFERDIYRC